MFKEQNTGASGVLVGLFCDAFSAVAAIRQLTTLGVAEHEIDMVGVLGNPAACHPLLANLGLTATQAELYREEFEDGAFMLVIRAHHSGPRKSVLKVLRHYGGFVPECSRRQESRYV